MELNLFADTDLMISGLAWGSLCVTGFGQHFPQWHGSCKVSSDLCSPGQDTFLLPCYRVASSLVKWPQQALLSAGSTAAICNPAWEQQNFRTSRTSWKTVSRHKSAGGYWSTQVLHHWSNVQPSPLRNDNMQKMNKTVSLNYLSHQLITKIL